MKKTLLFISLVLFSIIGFSQSPPPPNGGNNNVDGNTPVGGGAPIAGGLSIILSLSLTYAIKNYSKNLKSYQDEKLD